MESGAVQPLKAGMSRLVLNHRSRNHLPTPIVAAGIGFFVALAIPGGFDAGDGFLVGFVVGLTLILLFAALASRPQEAARARIREA